MTLLFCALLAVSAAAYAQEAHDEALPEASGGDRPVLEALAAELGMTPEELADILARVRERVQDEMPFVAFSRVPARVRAEGLQQRVLERFRTVPPRAYIMGRVPEMVWRRWRANEGGETPLRPQIERQQMDRPLLRRAWVMRRGAEALDAARPQVRTRALLRTLLEQWSEIEWRTEDGQPVKPHIVWKRVTAEE